MPDLASKLSHLADYLAELHAMRHPPVRDITKLGAFRVRSAELRAHDGLAVDPHSEESLQVAFVELPTQPAMPSALRSEFKAYKSNRIRRPEPASARPLSDGANRWLADVWDPWERRANDIKQVKALHRGLFEVRELLLQDRETFELVWGHGRVRWEHPTAGTIDHPAFVEPAEVEIDSATQRLTVRRSGDITIDRRYLDQIHLAFSAGLDELSEPLDNDELERPAIGEDDLQRYVRALSGDGRLVDEAALDVAPQIDSTWVLYVRRRQENYLEFLDALRLQAKNGNPPLALARLVESSTNQMVSIWSEGATGNLRLPLATNAEQEEIIRRVSTQPAVVVQGPPGTGKSHTIANIVSHCIAQRRRVLVVSEKEQALQVIVDKLPDGIRDLTMPMLGTGTEANQKLKRSVDEILRTVGQPPTGAEDTARSAERRLREVNEGIAHAKNALVATSQFESTRLDGVWSCGPSPSPSRAAAWLAEQEHLLEAIGDPWSVDKPGPLPESSWLELERLFDELTAADATVALEPRLPVDELPTGADIAELLDRYDQAQAEVDRVDSAIHSEERLLAASDEQRQTVVHRATGYLAWIRSSPDSLARRVAGEITDPTSKKMWEQTISEISELREAIVESAAPLLRHQISFSTELGPDDHEQLEQIRGRFAAGKTLGPFQGRAKNLLSSMTVDGHPPADLAATELVLAALEVTTKRRQLANYWNQRVEHVGGRQIDAVRPEVELTELLEEVSAALSSPQLEQDLNVSAVTIGLTTGDRSEAAIETLMSAASTPAVRELTDVRERLEALASWLEATDEPDRWPEQLHDALTSYDLAKWDELRTEMQRLDQIRPAALRQIELLHELSELAPVVASEIQNARALPLQANEMNRAFEARAIDAWLTGGVDVSDDDLGERLEDLQQERSRLLVSIAEAKAQLGIHRMVGQQEQVRLGVVVAAQKAYGKGGGKLKAQKASSIRRAVKEALPAVPVWVMTRQAAINNVVPTGKPLFDVLIVDEASQLGIDSIPLLGLAERAIIVGDDEQTSPENIGLNVQIASNLVSKHLVPAEIDNPHTVFDAKQSLYDAVKAQTGSTVMLREHFRCLPEIIDFSNHHVYNDQIIPLRDSPPAPGWQPVRHVFVEEGFRDGTQNPPEIDRIVELIDAIVSNPVYAGMSVGVVSMLAGEQAHAIWDAVYERIGPKEVEDRKFRVGEAAKFQGDERDVIVLSMVAAREPGDPSKRPGAMTSAAARRRINVAASRAREQMWIVHSLPASEFHNDDLRGALIRHKSERTELALAEIRDRCESPFEVEVAERLVAAGYTAITPQYRVNNYRIDFVVEAGGQRLAVECDGEQFHPPEKWSADRERQDTLERVGWEFVRIRGSAFYRDRERAMEPLFKRLRELEKLTPDVTSG